MRSSRLSITLIIAALILSLTFAIGFGARSVLAGDSDALPAAGSAAPGFTMTSHEDKQVSLSDFRGQWVVLYFYPKDFTSGCTVEAHNFKEDMDKYRARHAVVVGVSVDTAKSHKNFCTKEELNFLLLSDADRTVSKAYGSLMGMGVLSVSARNTFIIDPSGKIAKVFQGVKPPHHSEEVLAALDELQKKPSEQEK
jgi:thioredoxin-dependent peroxiredoxin